MSENLGLSKCFVLEFARVDRCSRPKVEGSKIVKRCLVLGETFGTCLDGNNTHGLLLTTKTCSEMCDMNPSL